MGTKNIQKNKLTPAQQYYGMDLAHRSPLRVCYQAVNKEKDFSRFSFINLIQIIFKKTPTKVAK